MVFDYPLSKPLDTTHDNGRLRSKTSSMVERKSRSFRADPYRLNLNGKICDQNVPSTTANMVVIVSEFAARPVFAWRKESSERKFQNGERVASCPELAA